MTFALKTENGVSSCGGLLVSPIIGRFCGYLTSGRSPFSNGSTAVAARALKDGAVIPAPSAAMAAPECLMRLRRSIIAFLPFHLLAAGGRTPQLSRPSVLLVYLRHLAESATDTCVRAEARVTAHTLRREILASLTCRRLFRLRLGENFHELCEKQFPFAARERLLTGRRGVLLHEFLKRQLQLGRRLVERVVRVGGHGLIPVRGEPFGRGLKPHPARHFSRKIDFAPLGMPRW